MMIGISHVLVQYQSWHYGFIYRSTSKRIKNKYKINTNALNFVILILNN